MFREHVPLSWSIVSCGVPCSGSRVGKISLFVTSTLGLLGCVHRRFPSPVILQCSEFLVDSFEYQVGLGLSPCLMDKYLWEHIQIYLDRDDLLCLREMSRFHATCEWFGPGWTVALSPLVHVVRRPAWGPIARLAEVPLGCGYLRSVYPSQWPCAHWCWMSGELVRGIFCKRHRCFGESFRSLLG